jgi:hypothetical protein
MVIDRKRRRLFSCVVLTTAQLAATTLQGASFEANYGTTVQRAVALLPRRPARVSVINVDDAKPEQREYLRKLQAFILRGSNVVYLPMHGEVLKAALQGSRFHLYMLATVIWHEMAHLDGADEARARRAEEELWTRFMLVGTVDRDAALGYLAILKKRRPETSY